ncbi:6-phospho-beta-glucosidase [Tersicoccus phoenicis]|uniref:6-phospho-beta-glucosidase n=1 Tax=Tersicoccus phoenicis TaxID=554083 RepID=A0A1R1L6F4_9MICC|nr:6-phospho-beta-glucosidase [Tersicoccus phoenicis]OMH23104.1 6-phospho-beta-glucosidase [Tersicoccus phoenicis]
MRLCILGGGGFRVPLIHRALLRGRFAGLVEDLVLHDVDAVRLAGIGAVLAEQERTRQGAGPVPVVTTTTDLRAALTGADVVFAALRPGGTHGRVLDERIAMAHGLLGQETVGAGGLSYALRSVPVMRQIASTLSEVNPHAWLIDFTNPAGIVTEALVPLLGERVIGICDSPIGLVRRAATAAGLHHLARPAAGGSLAGVDYLGLNHLGWLRGLRDTGSGNTDGAADTDGARDRLPALLADPERLFSFEEGRIFGPELLGVLGAVPNEYLFYYYFAREAVTALAGSRQTRGETIEAAQRDLYPGLATAPDPAGRWEAARRAREDGYLTEARPDGQQRDAADVAGGGYEQVALAAMSAVLTDRPEELIVNVRNDAAGRLAVTGLPADAVVEVPCRVDGRGAVPLHIGRTPSLHQLGLLTAVKAVERETVTAVTERDRDAALRAFALHPLVDSAHVARRVLADYEQAFPALSRLWA